MSEPWTPMPKSVEGVVVRETDTGYAVDADGETTEFVDGPEALNYAITRSTGRVRVDCTITYPSVADSETVEQMSTPGPWHDVGPVEVDELHAKPHVIWSAEKAERVALVFAVSDATLIALAPEMAEMLQEGINHWINSSTVQPSEWSAWETRARALLARARGDKDAT